MSNNNKNNQYNVIPINQKKSYEILWLNRKHRHSILKSLYFKKTNTQNTLKKSKIKAQNILIKDMYINAMILKNKKRVYYKSKIQLQGERFVKKDNTKKILTFITTACVAVLSIVALRFVVLESGEMSNTYNDIKNINGINVGGLDKEGVQTLLATSFSQKAESFKLTLKHNDKHWDFGKNDFIVNSDIHIILDEAQQRERINSSYKNQLEKINEFTDKGKSLNIAFNYIFLGLDEKIDEIINEISYEAEDSTLKFTPQGKNNFEITPHKNGLKVNKEELYERINRQFLENNLAVVEVPTVEIKAQVTEEMQNSITSKVSEYSTNVSDSTGGRKANVNLALLRVNGLVIEPNQTVSFNNLTAPHTTANGYKVAKIIYNGQFVDGVGGGICQASTTLYNALLLADVEINEVYKHTLPVKYVPLALDAMVAEGIADLKFTNTSQYPLFIKTSTTSKDVKVEIFSKKNENLQLKTRSEVVKNLPHNGDIIKQDSKQEFSDKVLFKGEQYRLSSPRQGFEAKAYIDYYESGKVVRSKLIRHEIYYPQNGVIIEGVEDKPDEFNDIKSNIKIAPPSKEIKDTFIFNTESGRDLIDSIPTMYCP